MSGVYNVMAQNGALINKFRVDSHLPFGTPDEYEAAVNSNEFEVLK